MNRPAPVSPSVQVDNEKSRTLLWLEAYEARARSADGPDVEEEAVAWTTAMRSDQADGREPLWLYELQRFVSGALSRAASRPKKGAVTEGPLVATTANDIDAGFGALSGAVEDRPQQREFARHVADTFSGQCVAAIEAGTGTGKTLGYLVSGVEHLKNNPGTRLVVATWTTNLRDSVEREAKRLIRADRFDGLTVGSYKSKADYVCAVRLARLASILNVGREESAAEWLREFSRAVRSGGEAARPQTGCDTPTCAGSCPYDVARAAALEADVVVTTHSSLVRLAHDEELRDWCESACCVVDEADRFPESARLALREGVSFEALRAFGAAAKRVPCAEGEAMSWLVEDLEGMVAPEVYPRQRLRGFARRSDIVGVLGEIRAGAEAVRSHLADPGGDGDAGRAETVGSSGALARWAADVSGRLATVTAGYGTLEHLHCIGSDDEYSSLMVTREPYDLDSLDGGPLPHFAGVVYTSATLQAEGGTPFLRSAGAPAESPYVTVPSPYPYGDYTRACVVTDLPPYSYRVAQSQDEASVALVERRLEGASRAVTDVAVALGGRTLVLSPSNSEIKAVVARARPKLEAAGIAVLEGRGNEAVLLEAPRSVLFGVGALWAGIDVPGPALSAVVVVRLPVPAPSPESRHHGEYASTEFDTETPTLLKLRQGFGRLVRQDQDRGLFVVLDPRARPGGRWASVADDLRGHLGVHLEPVKVKGLASWASHQIAGLGIQ